MGPLVINWLTINELRSGLTVINQVIIDSPSIEYLINCQLMATGQSINYQLSDESNTNQSITWKSFSYLLISWLGDHC